MHILLSWVGNEGLYCTDDAAIDERLPWNALEVPERKNFRRHSLQVMPEAPTLFSCRKDILEKLQEQ